MAMHYRPLDSKRNEIRLLKIHKVDGNATTPDLIQCSLEYVSLVLPPPYTALSYCWGDPKVTKEIVLDGETFEVTTNLHDALQELRQRDHRALWVDAICVNQRNIEERNQQLLRMSAIYRRAEITVAWLGRAYHSTSFAFAMLRALEGSMDDDPGILSLIDEESHYALIDLMK
jgi:RimJ/RimL family protein N-acetyltransferase